MIKTILDEISAVSGKNDKRDVLEQYKDNVLLKRVIYASHSPRIKYYIKKLPAYTSDATSSIELNDALNSIAIMVRDKVRGGAASDLLKDLLTKLSPNDAYVIERIIGKDLKIGMDTGINKVIPDLIEETPYMGAKSFSEKGAKKLFGKGKTVYSQVKADGTYRNAIIKDGKVLLCSRQGEVSYLEGTTFLKELGTLEDCVLNGELTIDGFKRTEANGMISSIMDFIEKGDTLSPEEQQKKYLEFEEKHGRMDEAMAKMRFTIWDRIELVEYKAIESKVPYSERFENLKKTLKDGNATMISIVETRFITKYDEAIAHFLETQERGLEGTIIKASNTGWKDGKPTTQIKMKLEMNMDLKIIGFEYGEEGTKNEYRISTLNLISSCGLLKTNPAGMKEAMMDKVTANMDALMGTIVEIRCCGLSQNSKGDWSTQHPSIVELRDDKDTYDSLESCKEIEEMAKGLKQVIS